MQIPIMIIKIYNELQISIILSLQFVKDKKITRRIYQFMWFILYLYSVQLQDEVDNRTPLPTKL